MMVGKLASQIAGYKLTLIICVLLIPFLGICYITTSSIRDDLASTERSREALLLHNQLMPMLFAYERGNQEKAGIPVVLKQLQKVVSDPDSEKKIADLLAAIDGHGLDTPGFERALTDTVIDISVKSGLTGVVGPQSVFLSSVAAQQIPEALSGLSVLRAVARQAGTKPSVSSEDEKNVLMALGEWRSTIQVMGRQLNVAARSSGDPQVYRDMEASVLQLTKDVQNIRIMMASGSPDAIRNSIEAVDEASPTVAGFVTSVENVWKNTTQILAKILEEREAGLVWRLKILLSSALAVSLGGIGSAIYLFRSSFKRLDELQVARVEAEAAQEESEGMNRRLTSINNEIVHLNHELADKMRRLKAAQDELLKRGRLEQLGQLTATVAHELRNPLGAVRTSAFLLERKVRDKGLGVEPQLLRINNGISRCDSIITQLLDFSRTKQISAQATNLDEWLTTVIEEEAKRLPVVVEIECVLGLGGTEVPFDPARLQRAIINLVSNASEAMVGTGDDPTKFAVQKPRLGITTSLTENTAVITVSDNGPGISSEIIDKIREPLFTTKSFGTGLGIPAVEQIATQHGGKLEITSEIGHGARFSIHIPLKVTETEAA